MILENFSNQHAYFTVSFKPDIVFFFDFDTSLYLPLDTRGIVLFDICSISYIKDRHKIHRDGNNHQKERLKGLTKLVKSKKYRFSFLLAIIEKTTDYTNHLDLDVDDMIAAFKKDYHQLVDFIGKNNIYESIKCLESIISTQMDKNYCKEERGELSIPASISLLEYFNSLKIARTPSKKDRFSLACKVAKKGEELGLVKGYPSITICVASIYGCIDARKILKIKEDGTGFNPSNCLGDIMSFYRLARAEHAIMSKVSPTIPVIFRTEDISLESMHSYLKTTVLRSDDKEDRMYTTCIFPESLFPALYKKGVCINKNELNNLYELLDLKPKNKK